MMQFKLVPLTFAVVILMTSANAGLISLQNNTVSAQRIVDNNLNNLSLQNILNGLGLSLLSKRDLNSLNKGAADSDEAEEAEEAGEVGESGETSGVEEKEDPVDEMTRRALVSDGNLESGEQSGYDRRAFSEDSGLEIGELSGYARRALLGGLGGSHSGEGDSDYQDEVTRRSYVEDSRAYLEENDETGEESGFNRRSI